MPHPGIHLRLDLGLIHVQYPIGFRKFIGNQDHIRRLHNLERKWQVVGTRHAWHVTLGQRVFVDCIDSIFISLAPRRLGIGDSASLNDTLTARNGRERTHLAGMRAVGGSVGLDVIVRLGHCLPNSAEIRLARRGPWELIQLSTDICGEQAKNQCTQYLVLTIIHC